GNKLSDTKTTCTTITYSTKKDTDNRKHTINNNKINKIIKKKMNKLKPANFNPETLTYSGALIKNKRIIVDPYHTVNHNINTNNNTNIVMKKSEIYTLVRQYYTGTDKYILTKLMHNLTPDTYPYIRLFHTCNTEHLTLQFISRSITLYNEDEIIMKETVNLLIYIINKGLLFGMTHAVIISFEYIIKVLKEKNMSQCYDLTEFMDGLGFNLNNRFILKGNIVEIQSISFNNVLEYLIEILNVLPIECYDTNSVYYNIREDNNIIVCRIINNLLKYKSNKIKKLLYKIFRRNSSKTALNVFIGELNEYYIELLGLFNSEDVFIGLFNYIFLYNNENIDYNDEALDYSDENIYYNIEALGGYNDESNNSIEDETNKSINNSRKNNKLLFSKNTHNEFLLKILIMNLLTVTHSGKNNTHYNINTYNSRNTLSNNTINTIYSKSLNIINVYFYYILNLLPETRKKLHKLNASNAKSWIMDSKEREYFCTLNSELLSLLTLSSNNKYIEKSDIRGHLIKKGLIKDNNINILTEANDLYEASKIYCKVFSGFVVFFNLLFGENFDLFIRRSLKCSMLTNSNNNMVTQCFVLNFINKQFLANKVMNVKTVFHIVRDPKVLATNNNNSDKNINNGMKEIIFVEFMEKLSLEWLVKCIVDDSVLYTYDKSVDGDIVEEYQDEKDGEGVSEDEKSEKRDNSDGEVDVFLQTSSINNPVSSFLTSSSHTAIPDSSQMYMMNTSGNEHIYNNMVVLKRFKIIYGGFFQQIRKLYLLEPLNVSIKKMMLRFSNTAVFDQTLINLLENIFNKNKILHADRVINKIKLLINNENISNTECINGKENHNLNLFSKWADLIEYRSDQSTIQIEMERTRLCLDLFE
ncbi:hypothetical protein CDIK_0277, partial [Cucumispora dikerogammari]